MTDAPRRDFLGATDIAAIIGVSPFATPIDVWHEKRGEGGVEETQRMRLGARLEQAIADEYAETTGRKVQRVAMCRQHPGWRHIHHPQYPFLAGSPDRLVVGERRILECKASASMRGYSDLDVPAHVRVQVVFYLGLTGRDVCDVVLMAHMGLHPVPVEADPGLYADLVTAGVEWWQKHIIEGVEPDPDATEAYRRHLAAKYPHAASVELVATPEQALLADELRASITAEEAAAERRLGIENRIRAAMGEASVLIGPGWRITWREQAGRPAWKDIALAAGATDDLVAEHTPPPSRVFRSHFTDAHQGEAA